jgi:two-component system LytT family sensor kinase/two-component system sensor histidine kinase LytS
MIKEASNVDAVALTEHEQILAFVGLGSDHHKPGVFVKTVASKRAYEQGVTIEADNRNQIGCSKPDCPLTNVVITPLKLEDKVFGLLKLYRSEVRINVLDIKLAKGIASLLATQIKLGRLAEQAELKSEAELKALQAQVNPHFLFNALNTIIASCRIDPSQSRKLLLKLASIFRRTLKRNGKKSTIGDEIDFCKDYLGIEKARLGDRLTVVWKLPQDNKDYVIPPFVIQPLVENAILHGICPQEGPGQIGISVKPSNNKLNITVADNGLGIPREKLDRLFDEKQDRIGLKNIKERIKNLYGIQAELNIDSEPDQGTNVEVILPLVVAESGIEG